MKTKNVSEIGLEQSKKTAEKLNELLANYALFYQNTRGYHWNIKGEKFFELHLKFEELYTSLQSKIDEVAERIQTLGYTPNHNYSDYLKIAEINESSQVSDGFKAVEDIVSSYKKIIAMQRTIIKDTEESADEGTHTLLSDFIQEQEKVVWMYSSFLAN